jgi:hypothetical protein
MKHLGLQKLLSSQSKALDSSRKIAHGYCLRFRKFGLHAGIEELCLEFSSSRAVAI